MHLLAPSVELKGKIFELLAVSFEPLAEIFHLFFEKEELKDKAFELGAVKFEHEDSIFKQKANFLRKKTICSKLRVYLGKQKTLY